MDWTKDISHLGLAVIRSVRLSNAVGSLLVLAVIVSIAALVAFAVTRELVLLVFPGFLILFFCVVYAGLLMRRPDLLRSEEHTERMLRIAYGMGHRGHEVPTMALDALPPTPNPDLSAGLESAKDDQ